MIDILTGIISALTTSGHFTGVYLVDSPDALPSVATLPAAGVSDGGEEPPVDTTGGGRERTLIARVTLWADAVDELGTGLANLLAGSQQIQVLLDRNLLGVDGVIEAHDNGAEPAHLMDLSGGQAVRRTLSFRYQKME